jgi:hypothetical protein
MKNPKTRAIYICIYIYNEDKQSRKHNTDNNKDEQHRPPSKQDEIVFVCVCYILSS